jgi:DNA-directed RNA polymerase subunit RPC12/RpoP
MPSSADYKVAGTDKTDWAAYDRAWADYRQAQIACGELCSKCHEYMPFQLFGGSFSPGYQRTCRSCSELVVGKDEASSDHFVRCPACRATWTPFQNGFAPDEGDNEVQCHQCDHTFTVEVRVTYTYHSPAVIVGPEPEEEPEEKPNAEVPT